MDYLGIITGNKAEEYEISTELSKQKIVDVISKLTPSSHFKARNKLTGFIEGNIFKLKLGWFNLYPFLPTVSGDVSRWKQGKIRIMLSYSGAGTSLLRYWFLISHAIVVFVAAIFLVNLAIGKTEIPLTVNGRSGYFFNNIWLLLICIAIAAVFIFVPVLVGEYLWKRSKSETNKLLLHHQGDDE